MILNLKPKAQQRILVMSDLHGNLILFDKILQEMSFSTEDILIINGDISEKGDDSIGLFKRIIELKNTHEVYATLGNCDELLLFLNDDAKDKGMEQYMRTRDKTILSEFLKEFGAFTNFQDLKNYAKKEHPEIFAFVSDLPLKIETPFFDVVHAGIDPNEPLSNLYALRTPAFLRNDFHFDKPLFVGHYPTCLYGYTKISHDPIFDHKTKVYAIDGANNIKEEGQVNVIEVFDDIFKAHRFDLLDYIPAFKTQRKLTGIHVSWEDIEITILKRKPEFSLCRHISTNAELYVYNDYLDFENDCLFADYTNALIEVKENDFIHIIKEASFAYYVKCNGSVGWLLK